MHKMWRLGLAALAVVVIGTAGCGTTARVNGEAGRSRVTCVQKMKLTDHVRYHNMGIAWDGEYYYTVNGGNTGYSDINKYGQIGSFQADYDLGVDGRAIFFSTNDEQLHLKSYSTDLSVVDLDLEETSTEYEGIFQSEQSHAAMSPDGSTLYELYEGTIYVYDASTGDEDNSFDLSSYSSREEQGYASAVAASDKYLFVWAPESDKDILVYDLDGSYITKFTLPRAGFGFSLSWANDMLWIAKDADGGEDGADGTWYGYILQGLE
jgi:hypothetical protein